MVARLPDPPACSGPGCHPDPGRNTFLHGSQRPERLGLLPACLPGRMGHPTVMTPGRMLFTLFVYEPLGLFFAVLSLIRGFRTGSRRIIRLSIWLAVSLLLAVFYRQVGELAWVILPLQALAAFEIAHSLNVFPSERIEVGVVTTALLILMVYIWFDIAAIGLDPFNQFVTAIPVIGSIQNPRDAILFGALGILVLCILFVAFGWSARIAWLGTDMGPSDFPDHLQPGRCLGRKRRPTTRTGVELWTTDSRPAQAAPAASERKRSLGNERRGGPVPAGHDHGRKFRRPRMASAGS